MRLRCPALLIRNDPSMKQGSREARDRGSHSNEMRTGLVCLFIEVGAARNVVGIARRDLQ